MKTNTMTGIIRTTLILLVALISFHGPADIVNAGTETDLPAVVDTGWLHQNFRKPGIKAVFVDDWPSMKEVFVKGRIPGSVLLQVDWLMNAMGDGSAAPDKSRFETAMQNTGISKNDGVVLYGPGKHNVFTLGAFWLLDYFRHDKKGYLDGGLDQWKKADAELSRGPIATVPSEYRAGPPDESLRADAAYVLARLNNPGVVILDVRSPEEFTGEVNPEGNRRTGHIPGAVNLNYYKTNFNADNGTLKSLPALKKIYESHDVSQDREIIVYCQGGVRAANTYFVLKHLLKYPKVRNYVGSWGEWGNRVDFDKYPVEVR